MAQGWENFYVLAATASATFIGFIFIIVTLGADLPISPKARGVHAFVTPTLVHFGGVLLNALVLLVPWPSALAPGWILVASALGGLVYVGAVGRLLWKLDFVDLSWDDWNWYAGVPGLANLALLAGAGGMILRMTFAPYAIAAGVVLLLFVSIRNAWDVTLWISRNRDPP